MLASAKGRKHGADKVGGGADTRGKSRVGRRILYIFGVYNRHFSASRNFSSERAQNVKRDEMYIDFMGDKGGARLTYGGKFEFIDGETLKASVPD